MQTLFPLPIGEFHRVQTGCEWWRRFQSDQVSTVDSYRLHSPRDSHSRSKGRCACLGSLATDLALYIASDLHAVISQLNIRYLNAAIERPRSFFARFDCVARSVIVLRI